jgi:hypothetical protein
LRHHIDDSAVEVMEAVSWRYTGDTSGRVMCHFGGWTK